MKTLPTQKRAVKKREALIVAAVSEFSSAGFDVATAKSIAGVAGVATGTFYQYFENKNDILRVIATRRYERLRAEIPAVSFETLASQGDAQNDLIEIHTLFEKTLRLVFAFHAQEPALHQVLEQRRALDPELRSIMNKGEAKLGERVLNFVTAQQIENPEIVASNLFSMAEGIVHRLVFNETKHDSDLALSIGAKMLASYFEQASNSTNQ